MQIVYGGDDAFAAAICGIQNPVNRQYFEQQVANARSVIGNTFGEFGQRFIQGAQELYERYNGERALEIARAALNQVSGIFQSDIVRNLKGLTSFQIATPVMQQWVMANPMVRELYHAQRCDGYSDSYVDNAPGIIGEKHSDWREVMNGMVQFNNDGDWYAHQYAEFVPFEKDPLPVDDQFRVLNTWHELEQLLFQGTKDPTSVWNNNL